MSSTFDIDNGASAKELEKTINRASKGDTIKLAPGRYSFDKAIDLKQSGISLVGAGSEKTSITFTDKALANNDSYGIHLDGGDTQLIGELDSSVTEGDRKLQLDRAGNLEPGDIVRIWQDNDSAYFDRIGDRSWREFDAPLRTSMAKVDSVDDDSITLDRGVHFDFSGGKAKVERVDAIEDVSLQGFSIDFELGTPDNRAFTNKLGELKDYQAVWLEGAVDSQLSDLQVNNGPSIAYHFDKTLDAQVEDIQAHGTFNKGSGGNGYAYELRESYDGNYTGLEDSGMRHGLIFASWRSSVDNNVRIASTDRDINFHGGQDHGNTVHVERSIRDADADKMSTSLWINEGGESFGAVTDADSNSVLFDYVVGSRRNDVLEGSDEGVYLDGGLGDDTLTGGKGDDILRGGPDDDWGENRLDGGAGNDTALYEQDYDELDISFGDDAVTIGKDTLTNIEQVVFGDGTLLDTASGDTSQGGDARAPSVDDILEGEGSSATGDSSPDGHNDAAIAISGRAMSEWSDGYTAEVFVENTSDSAIADPEIQFSLADDIDTVWNGLFSEDTGDETYRITDNNARVLEPGDVWRFAFRAYGDEKTLPEQATLQGDGSSAMEAPLQGISSSQALDIMG